jgi:peptidoglycan/LPS O-acetylase OafA/YrhL
MKRMMTILLLLAAASVSPLIFPLAESGHSTIDALAKFALLPSVAAIGLIWQLLGRRDDPLARHVAVGLAAGAVATVALEAVRLPGFWLGFMPGNLPRLMASCCSISSPPVRHPRRTLRAGHITSGMAQPSDSSTSWYSEPVGGGLERSSGCFSDSDSCSVRWFRPWE